MAAKVGALVLPEQFSYKPPVPRKRHRVVQTVGAVKVHTAPTIVAGDALIAWRVQAATRSEWIAIRALYDDVLSPDLTFTGYWNEQFEVKALVMDDPTVRGALWGLSGSFQIISVFSWGTDA